MALVCEQFHRLPHEYARWLMGAEGIPPEVSRLDWHAFNVAAAAFLAAAHKQAQDDAERRAKQQQARRGRNARGRFTAARNGVSSGEPSEAVSVPSASATYTSLTLPEAMFTTGAAG